VTGFRPDGRRPSATSARALTPATDTGGPQARAGRLEQDDPSERSIRGRRARMERSDQRTAEMGSTLPSPTVATDRTADEFDPTGVLRDATGRGKSDVANKLAAMTLHTLSRRRFPTRRVGDPEYVAAVRAFLDGRCPYCDRRLVAGQTIVEHLDAMN